MIRLAIVGFLALLPFSATLAAEKSPPSVSVRITLVDSTGHETFTHGVLLPPASHAGKASLSYAPLPGATRSLPVDEVLYHQLLALQRGSYAASHDAWFVMGSAEPLGSIDGIPTARIENGRASFTVTVNRVETTSKKIPLLNKTWQSRKLGRARVDPMSITRFHLGNFDVAIQDPSTGRMVPVQVLRDVPGEPVEFAFMADLDRFLQRGEGTVRTYKTEKRVVFNRSAPLPSGAQVPSPSAALVGAFPAAGSLNQHLPAGTYPGRKEAFYKGLRTRFRSEVVLAPLRGPSKQFYSSEACLAKAWNMIEREAKIHRPDRPPRSSRPWDYSDYSDHDSHSTGWDGGSSDAGDSGGGDFGGDFGGGDFGD